MLPALVLALAPFAAPLAIPTPTSTPPAPSACNASPPTTEVFDPPELRSQNGVLDVTLYLNGNRDPLRVAGVCWWHAVPGTLSLDWVPPTLRLRQGDELRLTLVNELLRVPGADEPPLELSKSQPDQMAELMHQENYNLMCGQKQLFPTPSPDPSTGRVYGYHRSAWNETNIHFHGLNVSPKEPSDDVLNVTLCPRKSLSEAPRRFTYVVDIPRDEPPGTYWYHPHAHGESERQVLSQLTGIIIVDPAGPSVPDSMPQRLIVVRDEGNAGGAPPRETQTRRAIRAADPSMRAIRAAYAHGLPPMNFVPPSYRFGTPQACPGSLDPDAFHASDKTLRINTVELSLQRNNHKLLPHTTIALGSTEYWRFANTSADTILDVIMLVNGVQTPIPVTSRDGVPLVSVNGAPTWQPVMMDHVRLSPASRMEFYVNASTRGTIVLRTRHIDTGCLGDNDYERDLLLVNVTPKKRQVAVRAPSAPRAVKWVPMRFSDLARQRPVHHRYFVFTEYNRDDEPLPDFYITELSNPKAVEHPFAMHGPPDVTVKSGTVEDWTILNYTQELHEFHIHQIHFFVMHGQGIDFGEHQLLDTVEVPYGSFSGPGSSGTFVPGAVTLRMDFRDPSIVGEFVYHCHILSHEDGGMMARIRVAP